MRELRQIVIAVALIIVLTGCARFRFELYSDIKLEAESNYGKFPKRKTVERLLAEIWDSDFLDRNEGVKEEILNNDYGIFNRLSDRANFAAGRACFIREKDQQDQILLNRKLFPHMTIVPGEDVFLTGLDKRIRATLVHELFHDFWHNVLNPKEKYWFSQKARKFYGEMEMATTVKAQLKFLSNIGYFEPTGDHFRAFEDLGFLKEKYVDPKFFGTELYAILAERAFSGKIIIPEDLRQFYKGLISETYLNKNCL
ncbi:MAG: hypothetical protein GTO17_09505 [Candidatus Aminicenantes bacterium]|nr:hypothetical protein [Candidatus Aminicenantes bacterium]